MASRNVLQGKFLEYAAEAMADSALGLHLARADRPARLARWTTSRRQAVAGIFAVFGEALRVFFTGRRPSFPRGRRSRGSGVRR
jgi:hypothetical protein